MDKSITARLTAIEKKIITTASPEQIQDAMIELAELTKSIELGEPVTEQDEKRLKELQKWLTNLQGA